MSHEIRQHDVVQSRKQEWHGLADVQENLSLENCWLRAWDYLALPVTIEGKKTPFAVLGTTDNCLVPLDEENPTGEQIPLTIGTPYQVKSFKPVLNSILLEKITKAIDGLGLTLESCGTVMNRGRLFLSFGLTAANFQVNGQDFVAYLNILNGNDKSAPLLANTSSTKIICNNTFNMNLGEAGQIMSVKKTQFSEFKIIDMGRAIAAMLNGQKEFAKSLTKLHSIGCDEVDARAFFAGFVGMPDVPLSTRSQGTIDRLVQLFNGGAGNDGNDFGDVFNSVTDFYSHESSNGAGDEKAAWKNFVSSEFGSGRKSKTEAWNILNNAQTRKATIALGKKVLKLTANADKD